MQVHVRGYCERAAAQTEPGTPIRFVASTEGVARDGLVIAADGWELSSYKSNPVFLFAHDYMGNRPPIGRADKVIIEEGALIADVVFDQGDDFARDIERKYRAGFMNAVSVGWDTKDIEPSKDGKSARITKAELLDISAVPVPGDPKALMERQKRALADYGRELLTLVEPEQPDPEPTVTVSNITISTEPTSPDSARASWDDTAAAMARLYRPYVQRPETEREADYRKLARDYGRLKKTPPEYVAADALEALDPADIRGLFLEGEPELLPVLFAEWETRAGAVLSARNRQDIESAITSLQAVLQRSKKEEATEPTDDERALTALQDLAAALAAGD